MSSVDSFVYAVQRIGGQPLAFAEGDVLGLTGAPLAHALLVRSGLVSIVVELSDGARIEAAMIGKNELLGAGCVFGDRNWLYTAIAQSRGTAVRIPRHQLIAASGADPRIKDAAHKEELWLLAQAQQAAACNSRHSIEQRLCNWLLRAADAIGGRELFFTQEFLSAMLGAQRATVSQIAAQLKSNGLLDYRRGRITLTDKTALQARACECYEIVRQKYSVIFQETAGQVSLPANPAPPMREQAANSTTTNPIDDAR